MWYTPCYPPPIITARKSTDASIHVNECDTIKLFGEALKLNRYQTNYENSWWQRLELWYGKNPGDERCFEDILKWAIRNRISDTEICSTTK
jgi:hypothetical protein